MSDTIEVRIEDRELTSLLFRLSQKAVNTAPLMRNIAGIMQDSVEENFEKEGRPDKWEKLKPATIKQRTKKGYWPGRILQMRGELAASITSKYDKNSAIVGTNKVYAAIHQFGGDAGKGGKANIHARPYLTLGEKENKEITKKVQNYLQE